MFIHSNVEFKHFNLAHLLYALLISSNTEKFQPLRTPDSEINLLFKLAV